MNLNKIYSTLVRYLHFAINSSHLINGFDFWRKSTVYTEYLVVYQSAQRKVIKSIIKVFPWSGATVFLYYLVIEAIDCCYLTRLMVTSQ